MYLWDMIDCFFYHVQKQNKKLQKLECYQHATSQTGKV